jgi:hypothetical protein
MHAAENGSGRDALTKGRDGEEEAGDATLGRKDGAPRTT